LDRLRQAQRALEDRSTFAANEELEVEVVEQGRSAVSEQLQRIAVLWDQGRLSQDALGELAAEVLVYLSEQREQFLAWRAEGAPGRETDLVLAGLSLMEEAALALGMHPWEELRSVVESGEEQFRRARAALV
jgi:hypothetical protein